MPIKAKKTPMNAPKKVRVFETRDIHELAAYSQFLYKDGIPFKISVKTFGVGEPVKFRINADPMTDEKREEIIKLVKTACRN